MNYTDFANNETRNGEKMREDKKLEIIRDWEIGYFPIIKMYRETILCWIEQRFYRISLLMGILWIQLEMSRNKSNISIGMYKLHITCGFGIDYE